MQTEMLPNGLLRLNLNTDIIAGKSLEELDKMFKDADNTVCNSFQDAIIHESGHAEMISGMRPQEVKKLYELLKSKGVPGVSSIAENDGAEVIPEVKVLLSRKERVPEEAMRLYREYIK
ncbi:MAG: hypothetical protein IJH64_08420 [Oscillospiraceae bacterium]|nr:hypothetical protein [Oscillospiraceae bacterium]